MWVANIHSNVISWNIYIPNFTWAAALKSINIKYYLKRLLRNFLINETFHCIKKIKWALDVICHVNSTIQSQSPLLRLWWKPYFNFYKAKVFSVLQHLSWTNSWTVKIAYLLSNSFLFSFKFFWQFISLPMHIKIGMKLLLSLQVSISNSPKISIYNIF